MTSTDLISPDLTSLSSASPAPASDQPATDDWWRHAVIYQVYPRSWSDSDGDGVGDLPGITARLPYLRDLGVDAIWISPFYTSPQADHGYDVADYRDIDPLFGRLEDADALIARAAELGVKVIVDLVPNHSSDEHVWFQAALAAGPGSPERARYWFRDGQGADGELPPNNWKSVFGGIGWTRVTEADGRPGQWYLHLFDAKQPDLNWDNPEVRDEFVDVLRFWLDRGVAGFRVDVAHGLVKDSALPDWGEEPELLGSDHVGHEKTRSPYWDQDAVHEVYRRWRQVLDEYSSPSRILCGEVWVEPVERLMRYVRPDEMHQSFNFDFLLTRWDAAELESLVRHSLAAAATVGAPTTWVLSNHDVVRHATRFGLPQDRVWRHLDHEQPEPDAPLGLQRARAATLFMLGLPGAAYLYQGEELGLPEVIDLPDEVRQDPAFIRTGGEHFGRDGCRVPMPWSAGVPSLGFGPSDLSWLPQPETFAQLAVDQQEGVPGSTLELYRTALRVRREYGLGSGTLRWMAEYDGLPDVVGYVTAAADGSGRQVAVLTNLGSQPLPLPPGAEVLVSSQELAEAEIPSDVAVWLAL